MAWTHTITILWNATAHLSRLHTYDALQVCIHRSRCDCIVQCNPLSRTMIGWMQGESMRCCPCFAGSSGLCVLVEVPLPDGLDVAAMGFSGVEEPDSISENGKHIDRSLLQPNGVIVLNKRPMQYYSLKMCYINSWSFTYLLSLLYLNTLSLSR